VSEASRDDEMLTLVPADTLGRLKRRIADLEQLLRLDEQRMVSDKRRIADLERALQQIRDICQAERLPCGQIYEIAVEALEAKCFAPGEAKK
jgi:hypothetical protein